MALVNQAKREINAKIVFFGPGGAGKATNLKHIFGKLKPEFRGFMKSMKVQGARMLFFDFTPPGDGNLHGFRVRIHVYTISGQVGDAAAWKMVLKGVDGIVFVADAGPKRLDANLESLDTLASYLQGYGQSLSLVPTVLQLNKSELSDPFELGEMERMLNPAGLPSFRASSQSGQGVLQTLLTLVKTVLSGLREKGLEGISAGDGLQGMVSMAAVASTPAPEPEIAPSAASFLRDSREADSPIEELPSQFPWNVAAETLGSEAREFETRSFEPRSFDSQVLQVEAPSAAREEELSLELAGAPQPAGPGLFRLPLTIRAGARSKSVLLTLTISLDDE